ncbi:MAG: MBL fold metallo-hydrolase [Opitutae bacterium]|nr:MBL fold metallo-hydrolase [Opitutae bacterium]
MNRRDFLLKSGAAVSLGLLTRGPLSAQANPAAPAPVPAVPPPTRMPVPVTAFTPLRGDAGCFTGRGGTIGWLASPEVLVAVDTQFPDTAAIFLKEMPGRNGRTLDAVINTHHHGDHTGGNGVFRPAAKKILAQRNVPALQRAAAGAHRRRHRHPLRAGQCRPHRRPRVQPHVSGRRPAGRRALPGLARAPRGDREALSGRRALYLRPRSREIRHSRRARRHPRVP